MKDCRLTITTVVNNEENSIMRKGKMQLSPLFAELIYEENGAQVHLKVEKDCAYVERQGDYTLSLCLQQGKQTVGRIGILGSEGEVGVSAYKVAYSIGKDSFMLSLHYDLLFGEEKQEMKLRLLSRF
jgi:uncharacterized beta-barrel protein YwiB (DUF1934 family)